MNPQTLQQHVYQLIRSSLVIDYQVRFDLAMDQIAEVMGLDDPDYQLGCIELTKILQNDIERVTKPLLCEEFQIPGMSELACHQSIVDMSKLLTLDKISSMIDADQLHECAFTIADKYHAEIYEFLSNLFEDKYVDPLVDMICGNRS